jgi:prephenate dehydratase
MPKAKSTRSAATKPVKRLKIAYEGQPGAYSEIAIRQLYGKKVDAVGFPDFPSVHEALRKGTVDRAALPVENTLAGTASLHDNWDILAEEGFHAVAETVVHVHHCLMTLPGTKLSDIKEVLVHPQPIIQCRQTLKRMLPKAVITRGDTAASARQISETRPKGVAVIASRLAAETYGLSILHEGMEDDPSNYTRFLIAAREVAASPKKGTDSKISLAFTLDNAGPGSLFRAMGAFALRDIDLARIESRPIPGSPWRYRFFIDLRTKAGDAKTDRALEHLSEMVTELSVIGTYPAWVAPA